MFDLDLYLQLADPFGFVHVMFEAPADDKPYITGIFQTHDDVELDFHSLPLEVRDLITEKCIEEVKQRKQNQNE